MKRIWILIAVCSGSLLGCAGDYRGNLTGSTTLTAQQQEALASTAAVSFKVPLKGSNFYSLIDPNAFGCAGDLKTFYSSQELSTTGQPASLLASSATVGATIKPAYIRNISVDLTDTGLENDGNLARGCSYGNLSGRSVTSACATFDSSSYQGLVSAAPGSFLILGGLTSPNAGGRSDYLLTASNYRSHTVTCGSQIPEWGLAASGVQNGVSNCPDVRYTLGVENVTSGSTQLSQWKQVSFGAELPLAGSAAQIGTESKVVVTSGQMRVDSGSSFAFSDSDRTWVLDLISNSAESLLNSTAASFAEAIRVVPETSAFRAPADPTTSAPTLERPKDPGGLALFGYIPMPRQKIAFLPYATSFPGIYTSTPHSLLGRPLVSPEEQLWVAGGANSISTFTGQYSTTGSTYRFDPTFSPQLKTLSYVANISGPSVWSWLDSSPTTPLNTNDSATALNDQCTNPNSNNTLCPLRAEAAGTTPPLGSSFMPVFRSAVLGVCNAVTNSGCGTSYVLAINSLDPGKVAVTAPSSVHQYSERSTSYYSAVFEHPAFAFAYGNGNHAGNSVSLGDFLLASWLGIGPYAPTPTQVGGLTNGNPLFGIQWLPLNSQLTVADPTRVTSALNASSIPAFAYSTVLPSLTKTDNEFIVLGGSKCRDILKPSESTTTTRCPSADSILPGSSVSASSRRDSPVMFKLGAQGPRSLINVAAIGTLPPTAGTTAITGTPPKDAAMASARGILESGSVILVAWGGVKSNPALGFASTTGSIHYAVQSAGALHWVDTDPSSSSRPPVSAGSSLVFSHVTGKFYLFGGYTRDGGSPRPMNETWELSVTSSYVFTWKKLDGAGGLTCSPDCDAPPARFFHGMAEVNFNNADPTSEYAPTFCAPGAPCSFVIFMERGTSNGTTLLQDRWVFDPTANGARGHWQQVDQFPPRRSTSAVSLSYTNPFTGQKLRKILQFGGEFGLQSPGQGWGSGSYLPGILGDTWLFDVDQKKWDRAKLLGLNIMNAGGFTEQSSELPSRIFRQSALDPGTTPAIGAIEAGTFNRLSIFTPPPLAGHTMVVRENLGSSLTSTTPSKKLAIPEVFLFGGRLQNGAFHPLNQVYKFCVGSTGDAYPDSGFDYGICDSYDPTTNASSLSPSSQPEGRWLFKYVNNDATVNIQGSYLGAGTYDGVRDRILLYGGISGASTAFVTQSAGTTLLGSDGSILEYTPSSATLRAGTSIVGTSYDGSYTRVAACTGSPIPDGRYGHSMAYDRSRDRVLVLGGYTSTGALHTQTLLNAAGESQSQSAPELWSAKRDDVNTCYTWSRITSFDIPSSTELAQAPSTGMAHLSAVYLQSQGYGTGYYTLMDSECANQGPISSGDESVSKQFAGGLDIDLDRTQLGERENLLLSLTHYPLGPSNRRPDGAAFPASEEAQFHVHLMQMQSPLETLLGFLQPRHLGTFDSTRYPRTVQTLSILAPPSGGIRQDQILLPISIDPKIDRVRIERVSGSGVLIELGMSRMAAPK